MSTLTETEGFASPHPHPRGLMTINHLCQQKTFFQFSYQIKTVGNLFGLGAFLVSKLKLSRAKKGRGKTAGLRRSWQNGAGAIEPRTWLGCGGQVHKGNLWIQMEKVNPPSLFLKTLLIRNFQHYSDVNQWISIDPLWGGIYNLLPPYLGFPRGSVVKNLPANAGDEGDVGSSLGFGGSSGAGNGNSLQYSCLGNHMDRGACWATVHGVTKSHTWPSD